MKRQINISSKRQILVFAMYLFFIIFCIGTGEALGQTTLPVMVDYFDTATSGAITPEGITYIPSSGNFAMVDEGEAKLIIVDSDGFFVSECDTTVFGSNDPNGITYITSGPQAGNFAITDEVDKEVYIVNSSCGLQDQFDTNKFGPNTPQGIAFISSGVFSGDLAYVTVGSPDEVFIVSIDGISLRLKFGAPVAAVNPYGITFVDSGMFAGNLALSDISAREVFIVDTNGILQDQFDTNFVSTAPYGIAFDSSTGNFPVVDKTLKEVFAFNANGNFFDSFGTNVFGSNSPTGITYINSGPFADNYAIIDNGNDTVFFVDAGGILQDSCVAPPGVTNPMGITFIAASGNLAILDAGSDEIYIIDTNCALQSQLDTATFGIGSTSPTGITYVPGTDNFAFTDNAKDAALFVNFEKPGRLREQFGTLAFGSGNTSGILLVSASDNFAVVDKNLNEVFITNHKGVLQARFDTSVFSARPEGIAFDSTNNVFAIVDAADDEVTLLSLSSLLEPGNDCNCDLNQDGDVDGADLAGFAAEFGRNDCP
jgi:hypothetical protein